MVVCGALCLSTPPTVLHVLLPFFTPLLPFFTPLLPRFTHHSYRSLRTKTSSFLLFPSGTPAVCPSLRPARRAPAQLPLRQRKRGSRGEGVFALAARREGRVGQREALDRDRRNRRVARPLRALRALPWPLVVVVARGLGLLPALEPIFLLLLGPRMDSTRPSSQPSHSTQRCAMRRRAPAVSCASQSAASAPRSAGRPRTVTVRVSCASRSTVARKSFAVKGEDCRNEGTCAAAHSGRVVVDSQSMMHVYGFMSSAHTRREQKKRERVQSSRCPLRPRRRSPDSSRGSRS